MVSLIFHKRLLALHQALGFLWFYFRFNLKGQLNEVKLPGYKALWPLFETIVNAIQSIEESINAQNGQITILANRLEDRQVSMDGNEEINPFYEFQVIDNGKGFNSIN